MRRIRSTRSATPGETVEPAEDFSPIGARKLPAEGRGILRRNHQGFSLRSERRVTTTHSYRILRSYGGESDR